MKIGKIEINMLLILLGVVIFIAAYYGIYSNYQDKASAIDSEVASMSTRLSELRGYYDNLDIYEAGIEESKTVINEELSKYPEDVRTEDLIMYAIKLEDVVGLTVDSLSFTGASALTAFNGIDETGTNVAYAAVQSGMTLNGSFSYGELKDCLDYIYDTRYVTGVDTISVSYNAETAELSGSISLTKYFITDGTYEYIPTSVPSMAIGQPNLFGSIEAPEAPAAEQTGDDAQAPTVEEN